jgi:hypothetical protein
MKVEKARNSKEMLLCDSEEVGHAVLLLCVLGRYNTCK